MVMMVGWIVAFVAAQNIVDDIFNNLLERNGLLRVVTVAAQGLYSSNAFGDFVVSDNDSKVGAAGMRAPRARGTTTARSRAQELAAAHCPPRWR